MLKWKREKREKKTKKDTLWDEKLIRDEFVLSLSVYNSNGEGVVNVERY